MPAGPAGTLRDTLLASLETHARRTPPSHGRPTVVSTSPFSSEWFSKAHGRGRFYISVSVGLLFYRRPVLCVVIVVFY